ncbi:unnamed protein product [Nippostrongylus brasiliensis]|uniref:ET module n=1 Tax=Nippostrongylus brasiliensis TaxID=27835 RepID=A0A0N4YUZ9_NIPBR|nr:unnamed protein product [Nippostrongylus brasiliensis]
MTNQCSTVEAGLSGCCCNTDACLSPRRSPDNPLVCYVGLYAPKAKVNVGAEVICNGMCSSLNTMVNGDNVTSFQCVDNSSPDNPLVCYVGLYAPKAKVNVGAEVICNGMCSSLNTMVNGDNACCCDSSNNCNVANYTMIKPPPPSVPSSPISCWSGIYVNGVAVTKSGYLGTNNRDCATLPGDRELEACCCDDYDNCNTKFPNNPLTCYVGLNAPKAGINVGAETICMGMCASLNGMMNGDNVTAFHCVPKSVCKYVLGYIFG